ATDQTQQNTQAELLNQAGENAPVKTGLACQQHGDQGDGQEHGHRIVAAGFNFQRRADPFVQTFAVQQVKNHGRIGGADNGADQQSLEQGQVEQPGRGNTRQARGNDHAGGGQG